MFKRFLIIFVLLLGMSPFLFAAKDAHRNNLYVIINNITIKGNAITKRKIILRELEIKTGDTLRWSTLENKIITSRQNLLNTNLFNFVTIKPEYDGVRKINLLVSVVERWYIWPIPILATQDRNFNVWWEKKRLDRLDYGINLLVYNFRGRREILNIILKNGYNKSFQVKWATPYFNKKETWGLGFWGGIVFNHQTDYAVEDNKLVFFSEGKGYAKEKYFTEFSLTYRPFYKKYNIFSLKFTHLNFADSLELLNPGFGYNQNTYSFLTFSYVFKEDFRDFAPYPLNGHYLEIEFKKTGLGILNNKVDLVSAYITYDRYLHLKNRWYYAFNVSSKIVPNRYRPYFLERGLGYRPLTLRGYELYVINGMWINILRSNLKFELVPKRTFNIPFIKSDKFGKIFYELYANLIFDAGYVWDRKSPQTDPLANKLLYGTGVGIDYVTYYDIVLRFEYIVNGEGQTHFFVSLVAPI